MNHKSTEIFIVTFFVYFRFNSFTLAYCDIRQIIRLMAN